MSKKLSNLLLILGALLIVGAAGLFGWNLLEDQRAGKASEEHLAALVSQIGPQESAEAVELPETTEEADKTMKEVTVDGIAYIGYLSIPSLKLELPLISEWSYDKLQTAPCRYTGTISGGDLVLMGHNYDKHFGKISKLAPGDQVIFTDVEGQTYTYQVAKQEKLPAEAVEEMSAGEYALTLFTCTYDGQSRITVRCEPVA